MSQQMFTPTVRRQPDKGRGWLFGCLALLGIGVFAIAFLAVVLLVGLRGLRDSVTDTAPQRLPIVEFDQETFDTVKAEVDAFKEAVKNDQPAAPLSLGQDDLNMLIHGDPNYEDMRGRVYLTIEGEEIGGAISIPLEAIGVSFLKGRYLNGSATFNVFLRGGILHVYLRSLMLKGEPAPEEFFQGLRTENLAQEMQHDPEMQGVIEKLESIEVKDGKLILIPKNKE